FFSCSYIYTRYLHSFPTRRSSDLSFNELINNAGHAQHQPEQHKSDDARRYGEQGVWREPLTDPQETHQGIDDAGHPAKPGRGFPDRKSTRLNSSHVKISYAVFCLK